MEAAAGHRRRIHAVASLSACSFQRCPTCAAIHSMRTFGRDRASATRRCTSSRFLISPPSFFQPLRSHFGAHFVTVSTHSRLSEYTVSAASSGRSSNAWISAVSSIRLFVVRGS